MTRARRSHALRVHADGVPHAAADTSGWGVPVGWKILPGVPEKRGDCEQGVRPCPYLACTKHLWLRLQEEQAGNPREAKQGATTFRPSTMATCALDVAVRPTSFAAIGKHLGLDEDRVRQIAHSGLRKIIAAGVDVEEMLALLEAA